MLTLLHILFLFSLVQAKCTELLTNPKPDLRDSEQYLKACHHSGKFYSLAGRLEFFKKGSTPPSNCDHLIELSFFVKQYLNRWQTFYQGIATKVERESFCSAFEKNFAKLKSELNSEANILSLDVRVHDFKNKIVMVVDGETNQIRLDGVAAQIFTHDDRYGQRGFNGFIPKEGDLSTMKNFLDGPVTDAVSHFESVFLENQKDLISSIDPKLSSLKLSVRKEKIAQEAIAKITERQKAMTSLVAQYEKHLQQEARYLHFKTMFEKRYRTRPPGSEKLPPPDLFRPKWTQSSQVPQLHAPVRNQIRLPPAPELIPTVAVGAKRNHLSFKDALSKTSGIAQLPMPASNQIHLPPKSDLIPAISVGAKRNYLSFKDALTKPAGVPQLHVPTSNQIHLPPIPVFIPTIAVGAKLNYLSYKDALQAGSKNFEANAAMHTLEEVGKKALRVIKYRIK